jgi:hypothetical protein
VYKYPVIKDDKEYAVSIYKTPWCLMGYEVKLYVKTKFLWFTYEKKVHEDDYMYNRNDQWCIKEIQNGTLYKTLTKFTINKYEESLRGIETDECVRYFNEWDGRL